MNLFLGRNERIPKITGKNHGKFLGSGKALISFKLEETPALATANDRSGAQQSRTAHS
jgi:hypothetical protein